MLRFLHVHIYIMYVCVYFLQIHIISTSFKNAQNIQQWHLKNTLIGVLHWVRLTLIVLDSGRFRDGFSLLWVTFNKTLLQKKIHCIVLDYKNCLFRYKWVYMYMCVCYFYYRKKKYRYQWYYYAVFFHHSIKIYINLCCNSEAIYLNFQIPLISICLTIWLYDIRGN